MLSLVSCFYNTLQHAATCCNTLQHAATRFNTPQCPATRCNNATAHCNTLQHTATHLGWLQGARISTFSVLCCKRAMQMYGSSCTNAPQKQGFSQKRPINWGILHVNHPCSFAKENRTNRALLPALLLRTLAKEPKTLRGPPPPGLSTCYLWICIMHLIWIFFSRHVMFDISFVMRVCVCFICMKMYRNMYVYI